MTEELKFPLDSAPTCLSCGLRCDRHAVSRYNTNGNAGRYYYNCPENATHGTRFCCWDDDRGISSTNPRCECGWTSREFTAHGQEYYSCPIGTCDWKIAVSALWSDCSLLEEYFGKPMVLDLEGSSDQSRRLPLDIKLDSGFKWDITRDTDASPLCSICRAVLKTLREEDDSMMANVCPERRSRAGCHLCSLFVRFASSRRSTKIEQGQSFVCRYAFNEMDLGQATLYFEWNKPIEGTTSAYRTHYAELGCRPTTQDVSEGAGTSSLTSPLDKSMSLAREWIAKCDSAHSACRNKVISDFIPTRVIDVGEKRIFYSLIQPVLRESKTLPPRSRYVTLSHCWGGNVPIRLLKSNISDMMTHTPFDKLPKTFQDAIVVTQNLGLRYIWIDSLCIVQDDSQDWQHEAALMADVYKNATCNLTAAAAANSSIGLFLDRNPLYINPVKAYFVTGNDGIVLHDFWPEGVLRSVQDGPLMRRGWVVQERLLSRRNLHFMCDQIIWECRSLSVNETFPEKTPFKELPRFLKHSFSRIVYDGDEGPQSLAQVWDTLVYQYTRSELTYHTDKLIAFGGIASTFKGLLGQRYIAGAWLDNLAYQLCWTGNRSKSQKYVAPSWSWASVEGVVENVFLPVYPPAIVRPMEILEAHVELASHNPYGHINSGYLRVAGRITLTKILFEENYAVLHIPSATGTYCRVSESLSLSWTDNVKLGTQQSSFHAGIFYLLAAMEHVNAEREHELMRSGKPQLDSQRAPGSRWLILCPVQNEPATFTRCGVLSPRDSSSALFKNACQWYDGQSETLAVHSYTEQMQPTYALTIL